MKIEIIKSNQIGQAHHGWLKTKHYFSFANYYNPKRMGFGVLRVINDDIISAGGGFGPHPHRDMEIITIPLKGAVQHEDSYGNKGVVNAGEVQVMSAGTGIIHSEYNHFKDQELQLFQIWIEPSRRGQEPRYDQKSFPITSTNHWHLLVSPAKDEKSPGLKIFQNAYISRSTIQQQTHLEYNKHQTSNGVFVLVVSGEVDVLDNHLMQRDAAEIQEVDAIRLTALQESDVIILEVPLVNLPDIQ
jgi:quercetin 2,3-dioxygenase